jgi:biotin carboxyl carrier protein
VTADSRKPARRDRPAEPSTTTGDRQADHAAIDRLADELVPALIAKLSATGLGEIEVGEDDWTVRVRRPTDGARPERRTTDRASRAQPGHAGHGHAPGGFEAHRSGRDGRTIAASANASVAASSSNGSTPGSGSAHADGDAGRRADGLDLRRAVATSPAVGTFQPRSEAKAGTRVRAGDRLGAVDMLGVPQEVVAPADGIVGASLVEAGQAVEYGQELIVIELAGRPADRSSEAAADRVDA